MFAVEKEKGIILEREDQVRVNPRTYDEPDPKGVGTRLSACRNSRRDDQTAREGAARAKKPNVRLRLTAGTRWGPKPGKQCCEMRGVLLCQGCELESQSVAGLKMADDRLGPDLAFLDKKVEPGFRAHRPWSWGSKKQTSRAQVPDAGNVIPAITTPIDPNSIRGFDARGMAPRVGRCLR